MESLELLKRIHTINIRSENLFAAQAQQNSPVKEKSNLKSNEKINRIQNKKVLLNKNDKYDTIQKENYIPTLCISKKEYESIVNKRPLIKFRPVVNTFIKSSDKSLLAESLSVPKRQVDGVINETIQYLLYKNPSSIYYNPYKEFNDLYLEEEFKKLMLEKHITNPIEIEQQELLYYQEHCSIIEPYIYRHGTKEQLIDYMKLQLSDAKSALKNLYNILDTESSGLYSYFERPIHVLDNRTILKMENIIKDGLGEAHNKGYISQDSYNQNVQWALDRIYAIQSDTSLKEAFKIVAKNS